MNSLCHSEVAGAFGGSVPPLPPLAAESAAGRSRSVSHPSWLTARSWEAADTTRLNEAHWIFATDRHINHWLREQLGTIRARATYEARNNPTVSGVERSLVDDVVGPDGPILQVQSSDPEYNAAAEKVWRDWFSAPTFRPNLSGAAWLRLCVRNLPRCGEYLALILTDRNADGPVQMRIKPIHPRRLATPPDQTGNPRICMGVEFDDNDCPTRYWIAENDGYFTRYIPYPPDVVIHEFVLDEEGQLRGFPWLAPSLPQAADLRDFDDKIQDAATQMTDQAALLYTENPDIQVWAAPESTVVERRTIKMAPPGWKPWSYEASAPPAQYPDYRKERHRDIGRPINMPGLIVRLDASRYNYSSARLDTQGWNRTVDGIECWISGTPESTGMLTRVAKTVFAEARFSVPALRKPPADLTLLWTFEPRPHVDPLKEGDGTTIRLENGTGDLITELAKEGTSLARHIERCQRARQAYIDAQLPMPAWMNGGAATSSQPSRQAREAAGVIADGAADGGEDAK